MAPKRKHDEVSGSIIHPLTKTASGAISSKRWVPCLPSSEEEALSAGAIELSEDDTNSDARTSTYSLSNEQNIGSRLDVLEQTWPTMCAIHSLGPEQQINKDAPGVV